MKRSVKAAVLLLSLTLSGCGLPVNQMTAKERKADMQWAFSIFEHNYAPAELKSKNFGVEMSQVEADCMVMAEEDMDNPSFVALFQKCIHTFKDAHIGAQQMNNGILPEYAQVAHLGFITMRTKAMVDGQKTNALRVVAPFKGSDTPAAPLVSGDLIIQVNGMKVGDYLMEEIVPYINVGQDETSLTKAAFRFGMRSNIDMALPTDEDIELVVARGPMVFSIVLPWITEDLLDFQIKQAPPEEKEETQQEEGPTFTSSASALAQTFLGYSDLKGILSQFDTPAEFVSNRLKYIAETGYKLMKFNPLMKSFFNGDLVAQGAMDKIANRNLPKSEQVDDLMASPGFTAKLVTTNDEQTYAYIQIKNFPAEDKILTEWYRAITAIEDKGVKSVIIDMIDNGGGSLVHGMRMLNMLRKKPLKLPSMQVKLNNNWVNSFKSQAAFSEDDYQKAISRRVVKQLEEDIANGKLLSRPIKVSVMDPFFLQNPTIGLSDDVKVALMVNEMCVSMCDIFASVFQENTMGMIVGQRTMGGGGNVVQHGLSPIAKIGMALTESLMITSQGKYIEDEGVTPDILVDMVGDRESGFSEALNKAYKYITVK